MPASPKSDAELKLRRQKIYIQDRLPELKGELIALEEEKEQLTQKAKAPVGENLKQLNRRRIFLSVRIDVLRNEQRELIGERKKIAEAAKRQVERSAT